MYRIFVLCFVVLLGSITTGCNATADQKGLQLEALLTSPRKLRKMRVSGVEVKESQASFSHFIFVGRANSQSRRFEDYDVVFAWEREPDEYIVSRLAMNKIKFQLHNQEQEVRIQFSFGTNSWCWSGYASCNDKINSCLGEHLIWATLHISEKDWPTEVSLPFNAKESTEADKESGK